MRLAPIAAVVEYLEAWLPFASNHGLVCYLMRYADLLQQRLEPPVVANLVV